MRARKESPPLYTGPITHWRLIRALTIAYTLYPDLIPQIEQALGPALEAVDESLIEADPARIDDLDYRCSMEAAAWGIATRRQANTLVSAARERAGKKP